MARVCRRCALHLQDASLAVSRRTFASASARQRDALPTFIHSSNDELNQVLSTLRDKQLIPALLNNQQRKIIYQQKYRQQLEDNPQTVKVGGKNVQLQWIDRRRDVPARKTLLKKALDIILNAEGHDWRNLMPVLRAMHQSLKTKPTDAVTEKIIRKAINAGRLGLVVECFQQAHRTGLTLRDEPALRAVIFGLHQVAQQSGWEKTALEKALKDANVVSALLDSEEHGSGRDLTENDPRTRPEVLGLFLELVAVHCYKNPLDKDGEGLVKTYCKRLVDCLGDGNVERKGFALGTESTGRHWTLLGAVPVWHGLTLAQRILGKDMPKPKVAQAAIQNYESAIRALISEIEKRNPEPNTYDHEALSTWKDCIHE